MTDDVREFEGRLICGIPSADDKMTRNSIAASQAIMLAAAAASLSYGPAAVLNGLMNCLIHMAVGYGFEDETEETAKKIRTNMERLRAHDAGQSVRKQ